jgi:type II secretory pathway pseudopilin PulG
MEPHSSGRQYFTLRELLILVALVGLGLAILVPFVRISREESNRQQCTNNLRQIGLGIQTFHDIRQEIPPSYLTDDQSVSALPTDHITWPLILFPFTESNVLYEHVNLCEPLSSDQVAAPYDHAAVRSTSIPNYFCPTRRSPPALTRNGECSVGDYANISRADLDPGCIPVQPRTWDAAMVASRVHNASRSPATINGLMLEPGAYRSMTTFASVTDGISNTAFIGEKAVHQQRLGGNKANFADTVKPGEQDGTFYYGSGGNPADLKQPGEMAYWSRRLAPAHAADRLLPLKPRLEDPQNRFGGWHRGVTLFVLGDASVRAVNNATSTVALQRLGCRNDGQSFELP